MTAGSNGDLLGNLAGTGAKLFNGSDEFHTLGDFAKDDVLAVQPTARNSGDEELTSVGVGTSVGHGQQARTSVLVVEVFISKLGAIDGLATSAVVVGEVTTLQHEVGDDTVEDGVGVTETLFTSAKSAEVFSSLGNNISVQFKFNAAERSIVDSNVEVNLRIARHVGWVKVLVL